MKNTSSHAGVEKLDDSLVCLECAGGDPYIGPMEELNEPCDFCGEIKSTISLSSLAKIIDSVFRKYVHYMESEPPWGEEGSAPNEIIYQILGSVEDALVDAILQFLNEEEGSAVVKDGEMSLYDSTVAYKIVIPYVSKYEDEWEHFVNGVKHRGRFYLDEEQAYLERILRPLLQGELHHGQPPFVILGGEKSSIKIIYRARPANTPADQKRIFENPSRELAPPPPVLRSGGRMNAAGTSAFYGATDVATCVAELGIPFGGAGVVGKFEFLRPVKLLDFRLLSRASLRAFSYFDPNLDDKVGYRRFMQRLRNLLRNPVLPGAETLDYLPTQMIAEFLSRESLDGVLFVSSVTPQAEEEAEYEASERQEGEADIARTTGVNIVLFSHASLVEGDMGPPRRRVLRVHDPISFPPPSKGWLYVEVADGQVPQEHEVIPYPMFDDALEPTLRLLEDEIVLALPKSIEYKVETFEPSFTKPKERDYNF